MRIAFVLSQRVSVSDVIHRSALAHLGSSVPDTLFLFFLAAARSAFSSSSIAAASLSIAARSPRSSASSYAASLLFMVFRRFVGIVDFVNGVGDLEERERDADAVVERRLCCVVWW